MEGLVRAGQPAPVKISGIAIAPVSQSRAAIEQTPTPNSTAKAALDAAKCSNGWRITGYYTPREEDLPGPAIDVTVPTIGSASVSQPFLAAVRQEGWGLTRGGWYLGWNRGWSRSSYPLDSHGRELKVGMVAADAELFARGAQLRLPQEPAPWNLQLFTVTDVGKAVKGRNVDVYTGLGTVART